MRAHQTAASFESDFADNGDPVEVDLVLASDLPHEDSAGLADDDCGPRAFGQGADDEEDIDLDDGLVDETLEQVPAETTGRRARVKAADVVLTENADGTPVSVYQRLIDYGLLRKITDIVMAKVAMPWTLREDASQEVHATWARLSANPKYARNQMARYAYMSGQHAALKLRRDIGAVVAIPGALFRTGRNTAFMESIGAAVNPKDVDDYKDSLELSVEPDEMLHLVKVSDNFFEERLGSLNLSQKQRLVAHKALVERLSADDIAGELSMPLMYVERLLNQVTQKLRINDGHEDAPAAKPARAPRGSKKDAADGAKPEKAEKVKTARKLSTRASTSARSAVL